MYCLYILKSFKKNWHYIGSTENVVRRLAEYNAGEVRSTKAYRPLQVIYIEKFIDRTAERKRENFLKRTAKARVELLTSINDGPIV